ncbi:MAG: hypothetical protein LBT39_07180, partial [Treponema sp.]|nr:hypothetical protein [Treponema sp.]
MSGVVFQAKPLVLVTLGFLFLPGYLGAHIADEIAIKTTVALNEDAVTFSFDISSGVLFSTAFLRILDPDTSKTFEEDHVRAFSDFFLNSVEIQVHGEDRRLIFDKFTASEWNYFAAGVSTVILDYRLPLEPPEEEMADDSIPVDLRYELSFYPNAATYSLNVVNTAPQKVAIVKERRNEFLQDVLEIQYASGDSIAVFLSELEQSKSAPAPASALTPASALAPMSELAPAPAAATTIALRGKAVKKQVGDFLRNGFETFGILDFLRGNPLADKTLGLLLILAVAVGF